MPKAQLTEPLADAAEEGGFKEEMFAALKSRPTSTRSSGGRA